MRDATYKSSYSRHEQTALHHTFDRAHNGQVVTPAIAVVVSGVRHDVEWILSLIDERFPNMRPRGRYEAPAN
jgi:hypothetical protein